MKKNNLLLAITLLSWSSIAIAYFYFERVLNLPPCPLCILDRIAMALLGLGTLIMLIHNSLIQRCACIGSSIVLVLGFLVGIRHVWLERAPKEDTLSGCIPQKQTQDFVEWLTSAFIGTGDCSIVFWRIAGLSLADLMLIFYVVLAILFYMARPTTKRSR